MKIYNPNISGQQIGGGWTFLRNLTKSLDNQVEWVNTWQECDIFFITSVTIVDKSEVFEAHKASKKIVLRVDNMPRKSRNSRMSPAERMKEFAGMADAVIYQSEWALDWIGSYVGFPEKSHIILNGVDKDIFHPVDKVPLTNFSYLIVQYNRDENKRMPEAFDMFTEQHLKYPGVNLHIVGNFSRELVNANFDFFRGEPYIYHGIIEDPYKMAEIMQQCDILLYPSYSDACPNTVIEAKACGMEVWHHGHAGIGEACSMEDSSLEFMGKQYLNIFNQITGGQNESKIK